MSITVTEELLRKVIRTELVNYQHECVLSLTPIEAKQLTGHFAGIKAMGNGSITNGFNKMQANHEYWYEQRMFNKSVASTFKKAVITICTGGLLFALWKGIMFYAKGSPE